jgi:hypothetical protein
MNRLYSKIIDKLFFKKWIIGIFRASIKDIIRSKSFNPDITWLMKRSIDAFYADPFLLSSDDQNFKILLESYSFNDDYGQISLMKVDKNFNYLNHKVLLDTKSHLSYPFIFTEKNKTYIFPEARQSGKLSCYEFDPVNESINFLCDILELPLLDATILKKDGKYWIFGTLSENVTGYKLYVFISNSLLGPYFPHSGNPIKSGKNGTRSAGNFIEVDGVIYRPTQNCEKEYGESITIYKLTELNEMTVSEEPYMNICINKGNRYNFGMHTIHTINTMDDIIVVDGMKWTFSPVSGLKDYLRDKLKKKHLKS